MEMPTGHKAGQLRSTRHPLHLPEILEQICTHLTKINLISLRVINKTWNHECVSRLSKIGQRTICLREDQIYPFITFMEKRKFRLEWCTILDLNLDLTGIPQDGQPQIDSMTSAALTKLETTIQDHHFSISVLYFAFDMTCAGDKVQRCIDALMTTILKSELHLLEIEYDDQPSAESTARQSAFDSASKRIRQLLERLLRIRELNIAQISPPHPVRGSAVQLLQNAPMIVQTLQRLTISVPAPQIYTLLNKVEFPALQKLTLHMELIHINFERDDLLVLKDFIQNRCPSLEEVVFSFRLDEQLAEFEESMQREGVEFRRLFPSIRFTTSERD